MSSLQIPTKNWWELETYDVDSVLGPLDDADLWGPNGPALVRAYDDGSTQQGWGLTSKKGEGFMPRYERGEFLPRRTMYGYDKGNHAAALVMRSFRGFSVDIDGKNGGLEHAGSLGALPLTGAEVSKSGNGYHLFYRTSETWDPEEGFSHIPDQISIVQGVDIRGTGCIYHYPAQRWNNREIALAPAWLEAKLLTRKQQRASAAANIQKIMSLDETEILIMQGALLDELKKPIPQGRRNNTLFAIGQKLKAAEVPDWQTALHNRATALGLDVNEADKLVGNVENYN